MTSACNGSVCYNNDAAKQDTYALTATQPAPPRHRASRQPPRLRHHLHLRRQLHCRQPNVSLHYWFLGSSITRRRLQRHQTGSTAPANLRQNTHYQLPGRRLRHLLPRVDNGYGMRHRTPLTYERWDNSDINAKRHRRTLVRRRRLLDAWDGVAHRYGSSAASVAAIYSRADGSGCYDVVDSGCYLPDTAASSALAGFQTVIMDTIEPANNNQILTRQEQQFRIDEYWLNGKPSRSATYHPDDAGLKQVTETEWGRDADYFPFVRVQEERQFTQDGLTPRQLTRNVYDYFPIDFATAFGAVRRIETFGPDDANTPHHCLEYAYAHNVSGGNWLVNKRLRESRYAGNCGSNKISTTLYRYDNSSTPQDTTLGAFGQRTWTLRWLPNASTTTKPRTPPTMTTAVRIMACPTKRKRSPT
ncbi:MAG: hypothetical protein H6650_12005 [Ardenticatenales bacterium]|nr:hypothetical protein [Ardenticatenales bacterium]